MPELTLKRCAFNAGDDSCTALTIKKCEGCRFRKSNDELIEGRERAAARIQTFPKDYQAHIKSKYSQREQRY